MNSGEQAPSLKVSTLKKATYENLVRLAKWLGLRVTPGMSQNQLAKLVRWKTSR